MCITLFSIGSSSLQKADARTNDSNPLTMEVASNAVPDSLQSCSKIICCQCSSPQSAYDVIYIRYEVWNVASAQE